MIRNMKLSKVSQGITILFLVLIVVMSVPSIIQYKDKGKEINIEAIQKTVEKYVIQCYAAEGSYPADLYYLQENYGLILDEEQYSYQYEIFASNIMPEIKVVLKSNL